MSGTALRLLRAGLLMSILSTLLSACSPIGLVNGVAKVYPADVQRDIAYGENPKQALDLYLPSPERLTAGQKTPVVVFFYGGSWNSGDKSMYGFIGRRMAAAGFITAVANYRLYRRRQYHAERQPDTPSPHRSPDPEVSRHSITY